MPEFIEETPVVSPEQLSGERAEQPEELSPVDQVREEEQAKLEEKPLIAGKYKTPDDILKELEDYKGKHADANRRLEEFNKSEKVRAAWAEEQKAKQEQEAAALERNQREREVLRLADEYVKAGQNDKAFGLLRDYHAYNAAAIAKAMLEQELGPIRQELAGYKMKTAEEQFVNHPDLQDIKHLSKQAVTLLNKGWQPQEIVDFLRSTNPQAPTPRREAPAEEANVVDFPDMREEVRAASRSLPPGGGASGPRRSAWDQEKLAAKAQARKMEDMFGPLPKRNNG